MSSSPTDNVFPGDDSGFDSRDCLIIYDDGPGDTTVRPCRPELLPYLLAEREKIARWEKWLKERKDQGENDSPKEDA